MFTEIQNSLCTCISSVILNISTKKSLIAYYNLHTQKYNTPQEIFFCT